MAIKEKKEQFTTPEPTPENPVLMRLKWYQHIVAFTSPIFGVVVNHGKYWNVGEFRDGWTRFDNQSVWETVKPPVAEPVLKLPFARRFTHTSSTVDVVYHSMNEYGHYVGFNLKYAERCVDTKADILTNSIPIEITGPTRKPAEVVYPAVFADCEGRCGFYQSPTSGFCITPGGWFGKPANNPENFKLLPDHPLTVKQPEGEYELPFAFKSNSVYVAYKIDGGVISAVQVANGGGSNIGVVIDWTSNHNFTPATI